MKAALMREINADDGITTVAQLEQKLAQAHVTLDLRIIDDLLHEDYRIVQPGGLVETKAEVLASYQTGDRTWTKAAVDQLDIQQYGNSLVVVGRWMASGRNGSELFDYQARFLSVWIKQAGAWKNIAYQSTEIGADGQ